MVLSGFGLAGMKLVFRDILVFTGALAICAQQAGPNRAGAQKEDSGFLIAPLIFKDDGCVRDYLKAQASSGLEKRKALAEMVQYGCVEKLNAIYYATVKSAKSISVSKGAPAIIVSEVVVIVDWDRTERITGKKPDYGNTDLGKVGWVIDSDIHRLTDEQMDALIEKRLSERSK